MSEARTTGRPAAEVMYRRAEEADLPRAFAVTGRCEGAQRAFWGAGLRFSSTPGLLLSSRPFGRLDRYVAASYGLF